MPFLPTDIAGLMVFEPVIHKDDRGLFFEAYNEKIFHEAGISQKWVQDNQSVSSYGVIRGLHYQLPPFAQSKLIRVLKGKILDVVVDIRRNSPTYGHVFSKKLSAKNKRQLYVPAGLAHGFSVLSETAEVLYKCDNFYNKESEGGILYSDPSLSIDWKIPAGREIVSEKDAALPLMADAKNSFLFEEK